MDVSPWLRPDGNCSPQRSFCHTYERGKDEHRIIPGWPYSIVAALETGRTSWTALLDAIRLPRGADVTTITCAQIRQLVDRLTTAGQSKPGDRDILIVLDAGYEAPRIAWLLRDLPIEILGRMRSDRVLRRRRRHVSTSRWVVGRPSTAGSSSSATPPPGTSSTPSRTPTPAFTGRFGRRLGIGCTHG